MRRAGLAVLGLLVSGASLWLLASWVDLAAAAEAVAAADPRYLLAALAVVAAQVALRSVRWRFILPPAADGRRVPLARIPPVLLAGYLGNAVLPARLGEAVRAYLISRREQVGLPEALGSVVLERVVDTASLAVLAFAAAFAAGAPAWLVRGTGAIAFVALAAIVVLVAFGLRPLFWLLRTLRAGGIARRSTPRLVYLLERFAGTAGGRQPRLVVLLAVTISTAAWFLDATTFWLVGQALDIGLSAAAALLIAAITVLGTALPSAPGFVGTFELAAAGVAALLGVPPADGLALGVLAHVVTLLPLAGGGAVSLAAMGISGTSLSAAVQRERCTELPGPADRRAM